MDAHLQGDTGRCEDLLRRADDPVVRDWLESLWGRMSREIHRVRRVPDAPPVAKVPERAPPTAVKREVLERDGFHCRFCGIPVVPVEVRRRLNQLYPSAARWGIGNINQHAGLQCLWLQFDHVLPHARGGDSTAGNVVITCAGCNFGRMSYTLDEMGLLDPRDREPEGDRRWDGLTRLLRAPAGDRG